MKKHPPFDGRMQDLSQNTSEFREHPADPSDRKNIGKQRRFLRSLPFPQSDESLFLLWRDCESSALKAINIRDGPLAFTYSLKSLASWPLGRHADHPEPKTLPAVETGLPKLDE